MSLLVMTGPAEKIHSFNLTVATVKKVLAVLSCSFFLIGGVIFNYISDARLGKSERQELVNLRDINEELRISGEKNQVQVEELAKKLSLLQKEMDNLKQTDSEIRRLLASGEKKVSLSEAKTVLPARSDSLGGPEVHAKVEDIENFLNDLTIQAGNQQKSFASLKETVTSQKAVEKSTPSIWPAAGEVTSVFGWRSYPSGWHPGIDIANDVGTPIMAAAAGVVTSSATIGGYGVAVIISHGNGIETLYGHNSQNLVREGQTVQKGDVIAKMGNTGFSTGPHVHYEVRVNGTAVNPSGFL